MQVTFELVDSNDNGPQFAAERTRVRVSEGLRPGASISLQPAHDIDSPANGIAEYQLVDETATTSCSDGDGAPFDLRVERYDDGSHDVQLILRSPGLDRELCDHYRLTLIARDGGIQPRSASQLVDVIVTDVNDHRPVLERTVYDTQITENVDPATYGSALVTVKATDADHGGNGQVRYRLSTRSRSQYGRLFAIDPVTGAVRLLQAVDYESLPRGDVVLLEVLAEDQAAAGSATTTSPVVATVRIRVRDVNDNAPAVTVQSRTGAQDVFHVVENSVNGTPIADVSVSDADTGDNGRVDCQLLHHNGVRVSLTLLHQLTQCISLTTELLLNIYNSGPDLLCSMVFHF